MGPDGTRRGGGFTSGVAVSRIREGERAMLHLVLVQMYAWLGRIRAAQSRGASGGMWEGRVLGDGEWRMANTSGPLTDGCLAMLPGRSGMGGHGICHGTGAHCHPVPCPVTPGTGRRRKGARSEQDVIACGEDVRGELPRGAEMARCGLNRLEDPYGFGGIDGRYETGLGRPDGGTDVAVSGLQGSPVSAPLASTVVPWCPGPGEHGPGNARCGRGIVGVLPPRRSAPRW